MKETTFYLDKSIWHNPNISTRMNRINTVVILVSLVLGSIVTYIFVKDFGFKKGLGQNVIVLAQIVYWLGIVLIQWRFGRKYVKGTDEALKVKITYFKPMVEIYWSHIHKIKFEHNWFYVEYKKNGMKMFKFKMPFDVYANLRAYFKDVAKDRDIVILE